MITKPLHVFMLPSANKNNTYLRLLSEAIAGTPGTEVHTTPRGNTPWIVFRTLSAYDRRSADTVIHIHWPTVLYGSRFVLKSIALLFFNISMLLLLKKIYSCRIIWTIHNAYAHDYPHPRIDRIGMAVVGRLADGILVHQECILDDYKQRYPHAVVSFVPHGNYVGVYGPVMSRDSALRREYGFVDTDIVLLSLGAMAPYKRNEKIIAAVQRARETFPNLKLLLLGKGNPAYAASLRHMAGTDSGVVVQNQFVPDTELAACLSVADYTIFYYDNSELSSGSMLLSLSYGVPVISRDIPAAEIITEQNGCVFSSYAELEKILSDIQLRPRHSSHDCIASVEDRSWGRIAEKTVQAYLER